MDSINSQFLSIEQVNDFYLQNKKINNESSNTTTKLSFKEILNEKAKTDENVKFSKHANQRLESRNIILSDSQKERLNEGVGKAREKSINDTLVMMDNLAFIVNVKNNMVVTALEQNEDNNVFTNIDGAVIV